MKTMNEEIKAHLEAGEAFVDVAELFDTTPRTIRDHLTDEETERYRQIRAMQKAEVAKLKRRKQRYKKEGKIPLNIRINREQQFYFTEEDPYKIDLWDYANDYDKAGNNDLRVDDGLFGITTQNLPFPFCQPAKRLQSISHGLIVKNKVTEPETDEARETRLRIGGYKMSKGAKPHRIGNVKYKGKDIWFGMWNWVRLDKPELPLVEVARHDVDTLNASVGFAESIEDRLLTQGDSCFISQEFGDRFTYTIQNKVVFFTSKQMPEEREVKEGEYIEILEKEEELTKKNHVKYDGTYRGKSKQHGDYWINYGLITSHRKLQIGDKLLGLTGLKVTICDIRENQEKDIVIHPKQIISKGKKAVKGAMVKELQECGKIMVGMRKDELLGWTENIREGGSVSSVLYPVLKIFAPKMLKRIVEDNSDFTELLKCLHLVYDNGTIKLSPIEPDGSKFAGHYLWDRHLLNIPEFYAGDIDEYRSETFVKDFGSKENQTSTWGALTWKYLYIPQFVHTGYVKKGEWKEGFYFDYLKNSLDVNYEERIHHGKFPFVCNYRKKAEEKEGTNEFNEIVSKILFCKIKSGLFLRALPTLDKTNIVLSAKYKEKYGNSCIVYREPVVGKNNVYSVNIKYDDNLSSYCVKLPLDMVQAANGDFDGDDWAVIPYNDSNLNVSSHNLDKVEADMKEIDLDEEIEPRTEEELIDEAINYRLTKTVEGMKTQDYGGARNRAAFSNDDIEVQKHILVLAASLEVILKEEKHTDEWKKDINSKIRELEGLIPVKPLKHPSYGEWSLHNLVKKRYDQWKGLVGYKPGGFWFDLFNLPETEMDRQYQALKRDKKIVLGEI